MNTLETTQKDAQSTKHRIGYLEDEIRVKNEQIQKYEANATSME